ncbi:hypothetical protein KKA69_03660 [Patescibacteria group bacterium]|nr:hypothetical protein [Patescibacteria group bacterium]
MGKRLKNRYEVELLIIIILIGAIVRFTYTSAALFKEDFWLILIALFNIFLFFLLTKRLFSPKLIALFLTFIFSILPWQIQLSRSGKNQTLALILTNIFFLAIYSVKKRPNFNKIFLALILFLLPAIFLTSNKQEINNLPFPPNSQDIEKIITYRGILTPIGPTFSRLYSNKATAVLKNIKINFFEAADINNYFFAAHPLERVGVRENEKFYSGLLPLFVIGLFYLKFSIDGPIILWACFLLVLSSFLSNRYFGTNLLLILPILLVIGRGLEKIMSIQGFQKKIIIILPLFTWLIIEIIIFGLLGNIFS